MSQAKLNQNEQVPEDLTKLLSGFHHNKSAKQEREHEGVEQKRERWLRREDQSGILPSPLILPRQVPFPWIPKCKTTREWPEFLLIWLCAFYQKISLWCINSHEGEWVCSLLYFKCHLFFISMRSQNPFYYRKLFLCVQI